MTIRATTRVSKKEIKWGGGAHSAMDGALALHPLALGLILSIPKNFSFDVAEIYLTAMLRTLKREA